MTWQVYLESDLKKIHCQQFYITTSFLTPLSIHVLIFFLHQTLLKVVQHKNIMTAQRESYVFAGCLSFIPIKMVPFGGWKCKGHNFGPENWAINGKHT